MTIQEENREILQGWCDIAALAVFGLVFIIVILL